MKTLLQKLTKETDFTSLYLLVKNLRSHGDHNKWLEPLNIIDEVYSILESPKHESESRSFFLYREISGILVEILTTTKDVKVKKYCIEKLQKSLKKSEGDKLRSIGDSLSSLPIDLETPALPRFDTDSYSKTTVKSIIGNYDILGCKWLGRSLINETKESFIVIKFAKKGDQISDLIKESFWMEFFSKFYRDKFTVPNPIKVKSNYLLSLEDMESDIGFDLHGDRFAIAYKVSKSYFTYPNENKEFMNQKLFKRIIFKNAKLLGEFAGKGLLHTALIPLFHNRVQTNRREDGGLYLWEKGGRLDSWLSSCEYPNFGLSGLRDFEHIDVYSGRTNQLYKDIGNHLLGFILVAGSFFRNVGKDGMEESSKLGCTGKSCSSPLDVRELFESSFFKDTIDGVFNNYIEGFTGKSCGSLSVDNTLIEKLINEMGVDNHMEEIIRVVDQKELSQKEFELLLRSKGFESSEIVNKGEHDIIISSGPHLGSFNGRISVPELTNYLVRSSSFCILEKYLSIDQQAH